MKFALIFLLFLSLASSTPLKSCLWGGDLVGVSYPDELPGTKFECYFISEVGTKVQEGTKVSTHEVECEVPLWSAGVSAKLEVKIDESFSLASDLEVVYEDCIEKVNGLDLCKSDSQNVEIITEVPVRERASLQFFCQYQGFPSIVAQPQGTMITCPTPLHTGVFKFSLKVQDNNRREVAKSSVLGELKHDCHENSALRFQEIDSLEGSSWGNQFTVHGEGFPSAQEQIITCRFRTSSNGDKFSAALRQGHNFVTCQSPVLSPQKMQLSISSDKTLFSPPSEEITVHNPFLQFSPSSACFDEPVSLELPIDSRFGPIRQGLKYQVFLSAEGFLTISSSCVATPVTLNCLIPARDQARQDLVTLTIRNDADSSATSLNLGTFESLNCGSVQPQITNISPRGVCTPGSDLHIYGSNFVSQAVCLFGEIIVVPTYVSPTELVCSTPEGETGERVVVKVSNDGKTFVSSPQPLEYSNCITTKKVGRYTVK